MFLTSVAYDYWKGFVTLFLETNDVPLSLFGKPPEKKATKLANVVALVETLVYILFCLLFIVFLAVNDGLQACSGSAIRDPDTQCADLSLLWLPFTVFLLFFGFMFFAMAFLYAWFTIAIFRYARSIGWIILFAAIIPVLGINVLLCFGGPFVTAILVPIQHATDLWQSPRAVDSTVPLFLATLGAIIRGFVRPRENDDNPYSFQKPSRIATILNYSFIILLALTIILVTFTLDGEEPFTNNSFDTQLIVAIIPLLIAEVAGAAFFLFRTIYEGRLAFKKNNPNGDSVFKFVAYLCLLLFTLLLIVTEVLFAIILEDGLNESSINPAGAVVPVFLALIALFGVNICPFFLKKKVSEESKEKEMMTIL
eukprot:gb/GECH01013148.1/.p1 GENE.gb/GECH01013148.1/~~gb/GECH01013148.1/.p1  ORF type:complete len:367 (+),score=66.82 gb/GECH01013148.1/:1-1101(+)